MSWDCDAGSSLNRLKSSADHPLAVRLDSIQRYTGPKSTIEELRSLAAQSRALGDLLNEWNDSMQNSKAGKASNTGTKNKLFSMLSSVRNSLG